MNLTLASDREFVQKLTGIVASNLANENFWEEELIRETGLSSVIVHHRVKHIHRKSVQQFICDIRLREAFGILQSGRIAATEVYKHVGFASTTHFASSFLDYFGFPPDEVKKRTVGP
jgi:AraC-like DNA-binding protein